MGDLAQIPRNEEAVRRFDRLWREGQRPNLRQFLAQAEKLSRAELAAILRIDQRECWQAGERIPAEVYMRDHLTQELEQEAAVDLAYHEFLLREELGDAPTCEEYERRFPQLAAALREQIEFHRALAAGKSQDVELHAEASTNAAVFTDTTANHAAMQETVRGPLAPFDRRCGDYELLEEIARGGMGVVYRARQLKLNRVVALKMILSGQLATQEQVRRFYMEAEAAAHLKHPGIVPIYEVGEHVGRHFYSMGFVEGPSLAAMLADGPLPTRNAAEAMKKIAEAVDYAHRRGVIHRDLKPSNILIDAAGEPHVTDFGLAKRIESESELTATGAVLGTPSFMPPEQARGDVKAIGPRSDVYGLGTILYSMLTGKPPFLSSEPHETLRQVREEEPASLRTRNPDVPRDLETVCLKCLAKEPEDRYASASQLAEDLSCFLADQPLPHARRAHWAARRLHSLTRAIRRRPWRAAYVKLSLVAFTLLAMILVKWWLDQANEFDRLLNAARAEAQSAEDFWQQGRGHDAQDHFARARDAYAKLIADFPRGRDLFEVHLELGHVHTQRGVLLTRSRVWDAAEEEFHRARNVLNDLAAADPRRHAQRQLQLAEVFHNLGIFYDSRESSEYRLQALGFHEQARRVRAELIERDPTNHEYRRDLARSYGYMGDTQLALGLKQESWETYEAARRLRQNLFDERPNDLVAKYQLGRSKGNTGRYWEWLGQTEKALEACRDHHEFLASLRAHEPPAAFQTDLANACVALARLELDLPEAPAREPAELLEQAIGIFQALLAENERDRSLLSYLARSQVDLGKYHLRRGEASATKKHLEASLRLFEDRLLREPPVLPEDQYHLAAAYALLSQSSAAAGERAENEVAALRELERAIAGGYKNQARLERDFAFRQLHEKERFKSVVRRMQAERQTAVGEK